MTIDLQTTSIRDSLMLISNFEPELSSWMQNLWMTWALSVRLGVQEVDVVFGKRHKQLRSFSFCTNRRENAHSFIKRPQHNST